MASVEVSLFSVKNFFFFFILLCRSTNRPLVRGRWLLPRFLSVFSLFVCLFVFNFLKEIISFYCVAVPIVLWFEVGGFCRGFSLFSVFFKNCLKEIISFYCVAVPIFWWFEVDGFCQGFSLFSVKKKLFKRNDFILLCRSTNRLVDRGRWLLPRFSLFFQFLRNILKERGVEEGGCKIDSGAPTVSQTTG